MPTFTKAGALAGVLVATATAAPAAFIDLTDPATLTSAAMASASGTVDGVGFTIIGSGGPLTYNTTTGPGATGPLAGLTDGIGVADDEIGESEYVTIFFDQTVRLTGAFFLDIFRATATGAESASIYSGIPPAPGGFVTAFDATETYAPGGTGFGSIGFSIVGNTFSFDAGTGNDGRGVGDFALAGLSFERIAAIPLPAGALLLGTALCGFGMMRRRR